MKDTITRTIRPAGLYLAIGMLVGASAVVGVIGLKAFNAKAETGVVSSSLTPSEQNVLLNMESAFSKIVEDASPAVVSIKAQHHIDSNNPMVRMGGKDTIDGMGSGVIIRKDGWILTNDHVVRGADEVTVEMSDGRTFTGKVRRDFLSDLAVVKIEGNNLPVLPLANSDNVRAGQFAIAIGSPFGLENTVTIGHISALSRQQVVPDQLASQARFYPTMIQTDAAINPGNSGGPLINIKGEVVGINTAIASEMGGSVGVGFAIPINTARDIAEQLMDTGKVSRGFLGLTPVDLKPQDKERLGLQAGALVDDVPENIPVSQRTSVPSPAFKAGVKKGDVITAINGTKIERAIDLRQKMLHLPAGKDANLTLIRSGKEMNVTVKVAKSPNDIDDPERREQSSARAAQPDELNFGDGNGDFKTFEGTPAPPVAKGRLGVQVAAPSDEVRQQFDLPKDVKGIVVVSVVPGTPAANFGLKPGDVIQSFNGTALTAPDQLKGLVDKASDGKWSIVVGRMVNGKMAKITLQINGK